MLIRRGGSFLISPKGPKGRRIGGLFRCSTLYITGNFVGVTRARDTYRGRYRRYHSFATEMV